MRPYIRSLAIGTLTTAFAVGLAAAFAYAQRDGTQELLAFTAWGIPLGVVMAVFAHQPRFIGLPPLGRAIAAGLVPIRKVLHG